MEYLESTKCLLPNFDIPDEIYVPFRDSVRNAKDGVNDFPEYKDIKEDFEDETGKLMEYALYSAGAMDMFFFLKRMFERK